MEYSPTVLHRTLEQYASVSDTALAKSRFVVGFSGGLDSTVLLHSLVQLSSQLPNTKIHAIHVHHGLLAQADSWVLYCRELAKQWGVSFEAVRVDARATRGESQEARARDMRYQAFAERMNEQSILLTAHHADDQAETVLIQLLRGAGVRGLSAMPRAARFASGRHWRPLLDINRQALHEYALKHQLKWVDDPSNASTDYDRNFLRHNIIPALEKRWPSISHTLTRTAQVSADAAEILDDVAIQDLAMIRHDDGTLEVTALLALSDVRRRNALMVWIQHLELPAPSFKQLEHIEHDVINAKPDATPLVEWPGCQIRRYRDRLYAMRPLYIPESDLRFEWDTRKSLVISKLGNLSLRTNDGRDVESSKQLIVRFRQGGETCRLPGRDYHHDVKKLMQHHGIPPWQRQRLPLIYANDELICVPGFWVCESYARVLGEQTVVQFKEFDHATPIDENY